MLTLFFTFLRSPLAKYLGILLVVCGGLFYVYHLGEKNVQNKWNAEKVKTQEEIDRLKLESGKITKEVVIKYIDRVKTVTTKGDIIVEYVDKYITKESDAKCIIPNNFVLLHDSAANNILPAGAKK